MLSSLRTQSFQISEICGICTFTPAFGPARRVRDDLQVAPIGRRKPSPTTQTDPKALLPFHHGQRAQAGDFPGDPGLFHHPHHSVHVFVGDGRFLRKTAHGTCPHLDSL